MRVFFWVDWFTRVYRSLSNRISLRKSITDVLVVERIQFKCGTFVLKNIEENVENSAPFEMLKKTFQWPDSLSFLFPGFGESILERVVLIQITSTQISCYIVFPHDRGSLCNLINSRAFILIRHFRNYKVSFLRILVSTLKAVKSSAHWFHQWSTWLHCVPIPFSLRLIWSNSGSTWFNYGSILSNLGPIGVFLDPTWLDLGSGWFNFGLTWYSSGQTRYSLGPTKFNSGLTRSI